VIDLFCFCVFFSKSKTNRMSPYFTNNQVLLSNFVSFALNCDLNTIRKNCDFEFPHKCVSQIVEETKCLNVDKQFLWSFFDDKNTLHVLKRSNETRPFTVCEFVLKNGHLEEMSNISHFGVLALCAAFETVLSLHSWNGSPSSVTLNYFFFFFFFFFPHP
jgi:hypothetical protein